MSTDPSNLPPLPKNHLDHPENWTTGSEPVTKNQANFIGVLESKNPGLVPEGGLDTSSLSKSDASDVIDKLKKGEKIDNSANDPENHVETGGKKAASEEGTQQVSTSSKRKETASESTETKKTTERKDSASEPTDNKKNTEGTEESQAKLDKAVKESQSQQSAGIPASAEELAQEEEARPSKKARTDNQSDEKTGKNEKERKDEKEPEGSTKEDGTIEDPIEVDTPPTETIETPAEPEVDQLPSKASAPTKNGTNGNTKQDTTPGDEAHLDHPENWVTGDQPATDKQKGFIKVLEKQKGSVGAAGDVENLGKSEASEKIEELKQM